MVVVDQLRRAELQGDALAEVFGFGEREHLDAIARTLPPAGVGAHHRFPQVLRHLVLGHGERARKLHAERAERRLGGELSLAGGDGDELVAKGFEQVVLAGDRKRLLGAEQSEREEECVHGDCLIAAG